MDMHELEIWVVVDASGDYTLGKDDESAAQAYTDEIGGCQPTRMLKVTLKVPAPQAVELVGTVPAESNEGTLTVK